MSDNDAINKNTTDEAQKKAPSKKKTKTKSGVEKFFENIIAEFRKIVWPNRNELIKQTLVVIIISLVMGVLIFGMDAAFNYVSTLVARGVS